MRSALGVGVIGMGVMGRRHAQNITALHPKARLVAVCDRDAARAEEAACELGAEAEHEPSGLLARRDVHAVVIATSPETHAALISRAAGQGKDILCEKPMAVALDEGRAAIEAVEVAGVRLQVGFMRRYDPAYRDAWDQIQAGAIGRPVLFTSISRDARPPETSYFTSPAAGNVFIESAGHDFDLARWLMDSEVASVSAMGTVVSCYDLSDVQPMDLGMATLRFRGGSVGAVQVYKNAVYAYDIRTEVVGTEGAVRVGADCPASASLLAGGRIARRQPMHWLDRFAEAYRMEMRDWIERMRDDRPPFVTGIDGLRALEISVAADQSRLTGREVPIDRA